MRLVKRLPGPRTRRSACEIAVSALRVARTEVESSETEAMPLVRARRACPITLRPARVRPRSRSASEVAGMTRPRTLRMRCTRSMPRSRSPPSSAIAAARRRLPTGCPRVAPRSAGRRCCNSAAAVDSASASAIKQLRRSPTGGMPSRARRMPEDPPSSAIETMAVRSTPAPFSPRRAVAIPVPPPSTTMRR